MNNYIKYLLFMLVLIGCKDPYEINVDDSNLNQLIIEAQVTDENTISFVNLSRSINVKDLNSFNPVVDATVYIEDENSFVEQLHYNSATMRYEKVLNTVIGNRYRVRVTTTDGNIFLSEYEELLNTPDIGDINLENVYDGLNFKLNTEDPQNKVKFFRWTFEEDWEIHSLFQATVWYDEENTRVIDSNMIDAQYCWKRNKSTSIILGTTENLSTSKLNDFVFHKVPHNNDRFQVRYTINIKQYALSQNAYLFLDIMKKNTESLGSIFDPQPSELVGNIVCITDPSVKVLGYFQAAVEKSKRVFINPSDLPEYRFFYGCEMYDVARHPDSLRGYYPSPYLPYTNSDGPYPSATNSCVDCRLRGGDNNKPAFW